VPATEKSIDSARLQGFSPEQIARRRSFFDCSDDTPPNGVLFMSLPLEFPSAWQILELAGTIVSIAALILYIRDKRLVEPVILRPISVRIMNDGSYLVQANLSNEGGRKATGCSAGIEIDGNLIESMVHVPVDSPIGRIGTDWAQRPEFTLYPHRPIPVRTYVRRDPDTRVSFVLRMNQEEKDRENFSLPRPSS